MKHFLFCLLVTIGFVSICEKTKAETNDYIKACILVNGHNPAPSSISGNPNYANKCPNQTLYLTVRNCGTSGTTLDPSNFDISWYNITSTNPTYAYKDYPRAADQKGRWVVEITYNDPLGIASPITAYDTLDILDYTVPKMQVWGTTTADTVAYSHCSYDILNFHATTGPQFVTGSYKWFINSNGTIDTTVIISGTNPTLTIQLQTSKWVTVMATDNQGCKVSDNIYSPILASPTQPNLGPDVSKCTGATVNLVNNTHAAGDQYYWNGSTSFVTTNSYPVITPGKYWVSVTGGLSKPCKVTDTIYVYDYTPPSFSLGNDTSVCYQASGPLHATGGSGLTYSWAPSSYFPSGTTGANTTIDFMGVALGTYVISVTATDAHSCTTTKNQNVTHLGQGSNPYMFLAAAPLDICDGTTKAFNTTATTTYNTTLSYEWTPSTFLSNGTVKNPTVDLTGQSLNTPVSYSLKITDTKGCYLSITTSATLVPAVAANVGFSDSSICVGNSITLLSSATGGTGTLSYAWSPATDLDNPAIANPLTTPTQNRLYTLTASDNNGCSDTKTVNIKAIHVIVNLISTDTSGYNTEPMVLNPTVNSSSYTYAWTNETTSTTLGTDKMQTVTETGKYSVVATEPVSGCHASDSINVTIQTGNPRLIYIPNVLNPASTNPDNKTVKVYGTAVQENDFTFRIYNKWGEMIYETTSFSDANTNGWNGSYKSAGGTEQNLSVYTYSVHGKYYDGKEFDKTGSITLMR